MLSKFSEVGVKNLTSCPPPQHRMGPIPHLNLSTNISYFLIYLYDICGIRFHTNWIAYKQHNDAECKARLKSRRVIHNNSFKGWILEEHIVHTGGTITLLYSGSYLWLRKWHYLSIAWYKSHQVARVFIFKRTKGLTHGQMAGRLFERRLAPESVLLFN